MRSPNEPDWMLPKLEDQPTDEAGKAAMLKRWINGMERHAKEQRAAAVDAFAARGWPFKWLTEWKPKNKAEEQQADALEEAIDVAARYYPAILRRGLDRQEDMGILQSKGWGGSEGIQAKRPPYTNNQILLSIYAVTGPTNLDPETQKVHFEPGAKSHVFHLVYSELPSLDVLQGDLAAYPIITSVGNRASDAPWRSEGWISQRKLYAHRPWNTIAAPGEKEAPPPPAIAQPEIIQMPKAVAVDDSAEQHQRRRRIAI